MNRRLFMAAGNSGVAERRGARAGPRQAGRTGHAGNRRPALINRRRFACAMAVSLLSLPRAVSAQRSAPRRIGFLLVGLTPESNAAQRFREGLRDAGYSEGRDVVIEWRSAKGDYDLVRGLVAEFIGTKVDVIVVDSTVAARVAKQSTPTIAVLMALVLDPVGTGLVNSLAQPDGNVTGLSMMTTELKAKRLQLLKEAIPALGRLAVLWNPDHPFHAKVGDDLKAIAPTLSIQLTFLSVRNPDQFEVAFSDAVRARAQALYVVDAPIFFAHRDTLFRLATKSRLPTLHELSRLLEYGGLMSYGPDILDLFCRAAGYVDRILKGARPADLPVEQPRKFELVVNLRTARALGLTITQSVLARADRIIE
jgi:putative ABC transport system substrate-binding protein